MALFALPQAGKTVSKRRSVAAVVHGEGAHAADGVADELLGFLSLEHLRLGVKLRFVLLIVDARISRGNDERHAVAHVKRERFRDALRFHARRLGGKFDGGTRNFEFQDAICHVMFG